MGIDLSRFAGEHRGRGQRSCGEMSPLSAGSGCSIVRRTSSLLAHSLLSLFLLTPDHFSASRDEQWSSGQRRHILQILTTLLGAPSVAGLVLGRDQRVRAAASFSREVKVADCAPDLLFNMAPPSL